MYKAVVHYVIGSVYQDATENIPYDSYEYNGHGTAILFHRRGYGDKMLPLFNVTLVEFDR